MNENRTPSQITLAFNAALFLFSAALGVFQFLLSDKSTGVPVEGLIITTAFDMVRFIVVLFITAYFVREFWNRLVANVFGTRAITAQEAIAFILILSILGA
jgi:hypothetical protein